MSNIIAYKLVPVTWDDAGEDHSGIRDAIVDGAGVWKDTMYVDPVVGESLVVPGADISITLP